MEWTHRDVPKRCLLSCCYAIREMNSTTLDPHLFVEIHPFTYPLPPSFSPHSSFLLSLLPFTPPLPHFFPTTERYLTTPDLRSSQFTVVAAGIMNGITASALALLGVALRAFYSGDDHHIDRSVVKVCCQRYFSLYVSVHVFVYFPVYVQSMFQCVKSSLTEHRPIRCQEQRPNPPLLFRHRAPSGHRRSALCGSPRVHYECL